MKFLYGNIRDSAAAIWDLELEPKILQEFAWQLLLNSPVKFGRQRVQQSGEKVANFTWTHAMVQSELQARISVNA